MQINLLNFLLVLVVAGPLHCLVDAQHCLLDETYVPVDYVTRRQPFEAYPFAEAGLQLYTHLTIPCNGMLVEWQFIAQNRLIYGLHLGVFRNVTSDQTETTFRLVNSTFIGLNVIRDLVTPSWLSYVPPQPFRVHAGDILGIFYERFKTPKKLLTIVNRGPASRADAPNTYIFAVGLKELSRERDVRDVVVKVRRGVTLFEYRDPALTAVISNDVAARMTTRTSTTLLPTTTTPTTMTTTTTTVSTVSTTARLAPRRRTASVSTARPRAASSVNPDSITHGATFEQALASSARPSLADSYISQTSPPGNATKGCSSKNAVVSASGADSFNASGAYPFLEAGLHIFEELRVDCFGYLTEWSFLAKRSHWLVFGLHLAVFRPFMQQSPENQLAFRIVNSTYIKVAALPATNDSAQWIRYSLPAEKQMPVEVGDYLGFYYDRFETSSKLLTIATSYIDAHPNYTAWVFEADNKTIEANYSNGILFAKDAEKTHRKAALSAKITVKVVTTTTKQPTTTTSTTTTETVKQPAYLILIERGQTVCSTKETTTTLANFPDIESCRGYVGDNLQQCFDDRNSFGACIDSNAECDFINANHYEIHESKLACYASVDSFFSSCVHTNDFNESYCSPIVFKAKNCYVNNEVCIDALSGPSEKRLRPADSEVPVYLNMVGKGKTVCRYKSNNSTIKVFTSAESCQEYSGDNKKHCGDKNGAFSICVDSDADCNDIGVPLKVFDTSDQCYEYVDSSHNSCLHVDGEGRKYCTTSLIQALSCYANDATCRAGFEDRYQRDRRGKAASMHLLNYLSAIFPKHKRQ